MVFMYFHTHFLHSLSQTSISMKKDNTLIVNQGTKIHIEYPTYSLNQNIPPTPWYRHTLGQATQDAHSLETCCLDFCDVLLCVCPHHVLHLNCTDMMSPKWNNEEWGMRILRWIQVITALSYFLWCNVNFCQIQGPRCL